MLTPYILTLLLILSCAQLQAEHNLVMKFGHFLQKIFMHTCAAQNYSIFINTGYRNLTKNRVKLAEQILEQSFKFPKSDAYVIPVVLGTRLGNEMSLRIHLQLIFAENEEQIRNSALAWQRKSRFLIVWFTTLEGQQQFTTLTRIFGHFLHDLYSIDVILLESKTQKAFTFHPYTPNTCVSSLPVEVDFQEYRLLQVYPHKLMNFYGCPLGVIIWPVAPYMKILDHQIQGLDAEVLKILAKNRNFSLHLIDNEPKSLLGGSTFPNGTMTGAFQMLKQRRGNFTIGCATCRPERFTYFSVTFPYSQVSNVIVLRSPPGYSIYEIMLFPFDGYTWLLLAGMALFQRFLRGRTIPYPILGGWLMLLFVLRISYESSIFKFVHNSPVRPLPSSFQELVDQGYRLITDHASYRMTLGLPQLNGLTRIVPEQPADVFEVLWSEPPYTGVFSNRAFLAYHLTVHRERRSQYVVLDEKIMENMLCMYFPRDSYLTEMFSHLLFRMRSFGVLVHHSQRLDWQNMPATTPAFGRQRREANVAKGFDKSKGFMQAALNCLMVALVGAICVFGLECLSQRQDWVRLAGLMERL